MINISATGIKSTQKELRRVAENAVGAIVAGQPAALLPEGVRVTRLLQSAVRTRHPGHTSGPGRGATQAPLSASEWWSTTGRAQHDGYEVRIRSTKTVSGRSDRFNLLGLLMGGVRAHEIAGDPYLAYQEGGQTVVRRGSVQHPGTPPDPFVEQLLERERPTIQKHALAGATQAVLRLLGGEEE